MTLHYVGGHSYVDGDRVDAYEVPVMEVPADNSREAMGSKAQALAERAMAPFAVVYCLHTSVSVLRNDTLHRGKPLVYLTAAANHLYERPFDVYAFIQLHYPAPVETDRFGRYVYFTLESLDQL